MEIITIPCLKDNYAYLLICKKSNEAAIIDPSEAIPVKKVISQKKVKLTTIFNNFNSSIFRIISIILFTFII